MLPKLTFVLGGATSGKSHWAENLLLSSGLEPVYLATARVFDDEIQAKINLHQSRRRAKWHTIEADLEPGESLSGLAPTQAALVDCATMWLSNHMMDQSDLADAEMRLLDGIAASPAPVVIVSNEVGHGIVPDNALARRFREAQGRLNMALAAQADLVVFVTAGLPQVLKGQLP